MKTLAGLARDETLWAMLAAWIGAVVASIGVGHLDPAVTAAVDASAGSISALWIGGRHYSRAQIASAATTAASQAATAVAAADPPAAPIAAQLAQAFSDVATSLAATTAPTRPPAAAPSSQPPPAAQA